MKKLIALTGFILVAATASVTGIQAQVLFKSQYGATVDTVTSAAKFLYVPPIVGFYKTITVYAHADEISGTTNAAITLEVSSDSLHWSPYYSGKDTTYTFNVQDVATPQGYRWQLFDWGDKYIRIRIAPTGSNNLKVAGRYIARKENS